MLLVAIVSESIKYGIVMYQKPDFLRISISPTRLSF